MYSVKVVADSLNRKTGDRVTTIEATYPRIVHEEVLTHWWSLVTASSRAVPTRVWTYALDHDPFIPEYWGANQSGMSAAGEIPYADRLRALEKWIAGRDAMNQLQNDLAELGVHKQIANRPVHAWTWITSVIQATDSVWANAFGLRYHEAAQPEFQCLAAIAYDEYATSTPVHREPGDWHLPYITDVERALTHDLRRLALRSTARVGRVSYFRQGIEFDEENEVARAEDFIKQGHWSTTEFAAQAESESSWFGNQQGWRSLRKFYPSERVAPFNPPKTLPGRYEGVRVRHWRKKHGDRPVPVWSLEL